MTNFKKSLKKELINVRHRAICTEGDYTGSWHADIDAATSDAIGHKNKRPGHVVKVLSEQTSGFEIIPD